MFNNNAETWEEKKLNNFPLEIKGYWKRLVLLGRVVNEKKKLHLLRGTSRYNQYLEVFFFFICKSQWSFIRNIKKLFSEKVVYTRQKCVYWKKACPVAYSCYRHTSGVKCNSLSELNPWFPVLTELFPAIGEMATMTRRTDDFVKNFEILFRWLIRVERPTPWTGYLDV